jgi:uncharacterized membrane protein SpoIIM required for sporulation
MVVHEFIRTRQPAWAALQAFLEKARRLSLARVPLDVFGEGSALYRQAVADLAYARMCYPDHPVVHELEQLVGSAHSLLYQAGRARSSHWSEFWRTTWPGRVRAAARPILLATGLFWAGAVVGFFLTARNPVLESFFVSPKMREAINSGHLWTESLTKTAPEAGSGIAVNNIKVSLLAWGLGLTLGIGTVWLLFFNGLMLGAIAAACLRAGMLLPLAEFIVAHGSLELPAIWISGGAGLLMAEAILFPGRYTRKVELGLKGRHSVQIIVGIVPILLVAGAIEAFVSPSELPGSAKALLGLSLAVALLGYIVAFGAPAAAGSTRDAQGEAETTRKVA